MESQAAHYTCYRARHAIRVDGDLAKPAWRDVPHSPRFVDMVTGEPGYFDTRAAALWDDDAFYVSFRVEEPFVEAALTERDSLVFNENDLEAFIDGGDCYYEFEVNALGTIYEVFFIWQDAYHRGSRFDVPEFDLLAHGALSFGGDYDRTGKSFWRGTHPRGCRWAFRDWDFPGLRSAVRVEGKINDRTVVDESWTAELAFPWSGMKWLANGRPLPPKDGDTWRMFFGRFEKLTLSGIEVQPHPAWCWNSHGVYDTHQPERWTYVHFSAAEVPDAGQGLGAGGR
ncbi:MAG TPA: carbohydrate-binding family 9-like protein [Terriglobia bacterium]|nr:carbohydrate-binding family 9-like protein [Terriglobia bacterium]